MLEKVLALKKDESLDWKFMLSIYEIWRISENLFMITDIKLGDGYSLVSKEEIENLFSGKIRLLDLEWQ